MTNNNLKKNIELPFLIIRIVAMFLLASEASSIFFKYIIIGGYAIIDITLYLIPQSHEKLLTIFKGYKNMLLILLAVLPIIILYDQLRQASTNLDYIFILKNTPCNVLLTTFFFVTNNFFKKNISKYLKSRTEQVLPSLSGTLIIISILIMFQYWFSSEGLHTSWENIQLGFNMSMLYLSIAALLAVLLFIELFFVDTDKLPPDHYRNFPTYCFMFAIMWHVAYSTFSFDSNPLNNIGVLYLIELFLILIAFIITYINYTYHSKKIIGIDIKIPIVNYIFVILHLSYSLIVIYLDSPHLVITIIIAMLMIVMLGGIFQYRLLTNLNEAEA